MIATSTNAMLGFLILASPERQRGQLRANQSLTLRCLPIRMVRCSERCSYLQALQFVASQTMGTDDAGIGVGSAPGGGMILATGQKIPSQRAASGLRCSRLLDRTCPPSARQRRQVLRQQFDNIGVIHQFVVGVITCPIINPLTDKALTGVANAC